MIKLMKKIWEHGGESGKGRKEREIEANLASFP